MIDAKDQAKKVVQGLLQLKRDKEAMAVLRKGLSEILEFKTYKYISRWCNIEYEKPRIIVKSVAAFYAMNPENVSGKNFGQCLRELAHKRDPIKGIDVHEKYLKRLLEARDYKSLCNRLAFVLRMIKSFKISVDYEALYTDIFFWNERTKICWAKAYYGSSDEEKEVISVSNKNNS